MAETIPGTTDRPSSRKDGLEAPKAFGAGSQHFLEFLAICCKIREVGRRARKLRAFIHSFGLWLSLVERLVRDQEAVGSNPTSPMKLLLCKYGPLQRV